MSLAKRTTIHDGIQVWFISLFTLCMLLQVTFVSILLLRVTIPEVAITIIKSHYAFFWSSLRYSEHKAKLPFIEGV